MCFFLVFFKKKTKRRSQKKNQTHNKKYVIKKKSLKKFERFLFSPRTKKKMFAVDDEEDFAPRDGPVEVKISIEHPHQREDFTQYVQAHETAQQAMKLKRGCRERIEHEMAVKKQKVINVDGNFFVRDEKVTRVALTPAFVQKGFVSFLRTCRQMPGVTDGDGEDFIKYLEKKREEHATVKKPTVKYCKKRPPEAFF